MLRFSILLPTHNRADVIGCAIESVLAQTEHDFELLIVGDGCTDNTSRIVGRYLGDKRVQWFDFPKGPGFGYNHRNTVLKKARGKYIGFVGHDDILFPDHLAILGNHLDVNKKADIVYSRALWVDRRGQIMPSNSNLNNKSMLRFFMDIGNTIPASPFVHRRSCFDQVGYWNEKLPGVGDWDMWKRIITAGHEKNVIFEPRPTTLHFLASWRDNKQLDAMPHALATAFAKRNNLSQEELKVSLPKGKPEQVVFWRAMSANPGKWVSNIRRATTNLIDAVNYYGIQEISRLQSVEDQVSELEVANSSLKKQLSECEARLSEIQNSLTFRLHTRFFSKVSPNSRLHRSLRGIIRRLT